MAGLTPMQSYALYRVREEYLLWQRVWQRLVRSTALAHTAGLGSSFLLQGDRQSAWEALYLHLSLLEHQGDPKPLCNAMKAGLVFFFSQQESRFAFLAPNSAQMIKWLQELFKKSSSSKCCQKCSIRCRFWPISNWWSQQHQQRNNSQELNLSLCVSSPQRCLFQKSIQLHTAFYRN